jgi:hypothetical protein
MNSDTRLLATEEVRELQGLLKSFGLDIARLMSTLKLIESNPVAQADPILPKYLSRFKKNILDSYTKSSIVHERTKSMLLETRS